MLAARVPATRRVPQAPSGASVGVVCRATIAARSVTSLAYPVPTSTYATDARPANVPRPTSARGTPIAREEQAIATRALNAGIGVPRVTRAAAWATSAALRAAPLLRPLAAVPAAVLRGRTASPATGPVRRALVRVSKPPGPAPRTAAAASVRLPESPRELAGPTQGYVHGVGRVQDGRDSRLPHKARHALGGVGQSFVEDLERSAVARQQVLDFVDGAHAAGADAPKDPKLPEQGLSGQVIGCVSYQHSTPVAWTRSLVVPRQ